jgi:voltage-gated sodium channel
MDAILPDENNQPANSGSSPSGTNHLTPPDGDGKEGDDHQKKKRLERRLTVGDDGRGVSQQELEMFMKMQKANSDFNQWKRVKTEALRKDNSGLLQFVESNFFTAVVVFSIFGNAVTSGLVVNERARRADNSADSTQFLGILENIDLFFVGVFALEMILRIGAYGVLYFFDRYNLFDAALVFISFYELYEKVTKGKEGDSKAMLMRILRSLRMVRLLRSLRFFHELRLLVNSLVSGLISLFWAMVLLVLITFITAVLITDIIHSDAGSSVDEQPAESLPDFHFFISGLPTDFISIFFGDLPKTMLTLFQVMTLESWTNGIARPANALRPGIQYVFMMYVIVISFGIMNMVIGNFVESSRVCAEKDAEYKLALRKEAFYQELEELRDLFAETDEDGSGVLTIDEFEKMADDIRLARVISNVETCDSPRDLFQAIDSSGEGSVDVEEFVNGVLRYQAQPTGLDVYNSMVLSRKNGQVLREIQLALGITPEPGRATLAAQAGGHETNAAGTTGAGTARPTGGAEHKAALSPRASPPPWQALSEEMADMRMALAAVTSSVEEMGKKIDRLGPATPRAPRGYPTPSAPRGIFPSCVASDDGSSETTEWTRPTTEPEISPLG